MFISRFFFLVGCRVRAKSAEKMSSIAAYIKNVSTRFAQPWWTSKLRTSQGASTDYARLPHPNLGTLNTLDTLGVLILDLYNNFTTCWASSRVAIPLERTVGNSSTSVLWMLSHAVEKPRRSRDLTSSARRVAVTSQTSPLCLAACSGVKLNTRESSPNYPVVSLVRSGRTERFLRLGWKTWRNVRRWKGGGLKKNKCLIGNRSER